MPYEDHELVGGPLDSATAPVEDCAEFVYWAGGVYKHEKTAGPHAKHKYWWLKPIDNQSQPEYTSNIEQDHSQGDDNGTESFGNND